MENWRSFLWFTRGAFSHHNILSTVLPQIFMRINLLPGTITSGTPITNDCLTLVMALMGQLCGVSTLFLPGPGADPVPTTKLWKSEFEFPSSTCKSR